MMKREVSFHSWAAKLIAQRPTRYLFIHFALVRLRQPTVVLVSPFLAAAAGVRTRPLRTFLSLVRGSM